MHVISDLERKARKSHRCYWCPDPILPGTTYRATTFSDGGDIATTKEHISCSHRVWAYARDVGVVHDDDYGRIEWSAVIEWEADSTAYPSIGSGE